MWVSVVCQNLIEGNFWAIHGAGFRLLLHVGFRLCMQYNTLVDSFESHLLGTFKL